MGLSSVKFLFWFLFVSVILWAVLLFIARVGAWYLSRKKGISIEFQFGGWRCLKDVLLKFKKGAIESISIGEIRLSLLLSFVRIRDPKLQLLLSDLDIVTRPSSKIAKTTQEKRSGKPRNSGKGKLMVLARFISVSVTDLVVKTPRATTEFKELEFDITQDGSSEATLVFRLHLSPIAVHICGPEFSCDQISTIKHERSNYEGDTSFTMLEESPARFSCEEFSLSCEFGHDRDDSLVIKNLDISSGEVSVNLNEDLFLKKKSSADQIMGSTVRNAASEKPPKKQMPASIMKYISLFPEKVCFNLPKLDVGFAHRRHDLFIKNNIMGIQLKSSKSQSNDDVGESTRLVVQMEFSEIHLFRESGTSVLEILKVFVVSSVYLPILSNTSVRAEIDIKLGGTRCNIMPNRLKPWIQLHFSKKKTMVLQQENSISEKKPSSKFKFIMWTCSVSSPEMTVVLYSINSLPLYHVCSQSSHMYADNISTLGTSVHMVLGELNLQMVDEYQEYSNGSLFGVEENLNSLMHIAKVSLDWGKKDMESSEENSPKCELVLSVDVTSVGINLSFRRLESLISTAMIFQILLKKLSPRRQGTQNRGGCSSKKSGKGTQQLKLNLERCHLKFSDETSLENTVIADPKRVNYGSQGGQVVICISADGTPRSASIMSTTSDECKKLKYSLSLDILQCNLCTNKEPKSVQMELERAKSIYSEERRPGAQIVLFDMQNAKFVQRSGGLKEISVCSYFSATSITVRWEPDLHLSILELLLRLKLLVHNLKSKETENECIVKSSTLSDVEIEKEAAVESGQYDQKHKKLESIIAIDVETMTLSAEAGDGVDAMVQIQSIFSENARIGVLLEGLMLSFNDTRVLKSSRMQISRIPNSNTSSDAKRFPSTMWDLVIQGLDVHICMPFRLQLRAIEDAIEDMLRGLKLITAAKTELIFPIKNVGSKPKKSSSEKFGSVKFFFRKIIADIEEEPIQGWLDEHFHLLKNEACELAVRLEALEHLISKGSECSSSAENDYTCEKRFSCNGIEVDMRDPSAICQMKEEIYKQSFRSYYLACQNLVPAEGSGACRQGFQAGFKPSVARTALLSLSATELDVSLTKIDGGDDGMIEVLRKLDPICGEYKIPFSRMFGRKIVLQTGSLVAHLRNYTFPLFSATSGKCEGCVVLAQQATFFQPQIQQDVFIGKWRKVSMLRSASGTTPPMKTYMELPLSFKKAEVSFGVGYEPVLADLSYAFTVALRRANLSVRSNVSLPQPPKKEKSLPWWDEVRNYIHGHVTIFFAETKWNILATTDPYEKLDKLEVITNCMEIQQSDGRVCLWAKDFRVLLNSLGRMVTKDSLKLLPRLPDAFLKVPALSLEVNMDWECDSGNPLNHYLFALPNDGKTREIVFDPFRSTSLSLRFNFLLRPPLPSFERQSPSSTESQTSVLEEVPYKLENVKIDSPTLNVGAYDIAWLFNFWNMNYLPPHKLRTFSRWARFGVPRIPRSGNLSLDRVMTEFMLRLDSSPTWIKHLPLHDDDPAKGLTFNIAKFKYEMYLSRGKQKFTFECKRDPLDQVYQGLDFHVPKVYLNKEDCTSVAEIFQLTKKSSDSASMDRGANEKSNYMSNCLEKCHDDGFLLSSDYFTIRKQAPKADPERLLAWQDAGRRKLEMTDVKSEFENGSESDKHIRSDQSDDDDGYNVVIADNCQRVFVYGLKLLWNIENRDAVWSFVGGISKVFEPPKPSPSRKYALKKLLEKTQVPNESETAQDDISRPPTSHIDNLPSPQHLETSESVSSPSHLIQIETSSDAVEMNEVIIDSKEEEGTRHFMVNVIEPQFNFHSEDANGRFLLAAASGRVLARSFHSVLHVGHEIIEQLGTGNINIPACQPEMTWKRMELSMMLEHVQAHVAPTDVDPGAGIQWLPKILRNSPKVKRTGALLERVFMPCNMYFRFTRHKGGTPDLKVKPLKELTFNSHDIKATMTSRQFLVLRDVLSNLLFARLPKPRKSSLSYPFEDDEVVEEEADEMVPEGVEEVELARVNLEHKEWELRLLLDDIQKLSVCCDTSADQYPSKEDELWMITDGRSTLVQVLKKELGNVRKCRKEASASLRTALQKAVQLLLMEKDKNKSPSSAMRMSLQIKKVVWGMLVDGKSFAEVEINDMIFDFERDFKDVGIARFTTKYFVVRIDLPSVKSDMLLSAWNPPPEWGKKVMLRVDARQGAPKDGSSPLELLEVEIYPLKIYLTDILYTMMWEYFFPEEEQDSQRRQEVWKVSTTAGTKRVKKGSSIHDGSASSSHPSKDSEAAKLQNIKTNVVSGSAPELRRTSSFDRTWEESVAESVANELVLQVQSSSISSPKCGPFVSIEQQDESFKTKSKDSKHTKSVRSSHEEKKVAKSHEEKRPKKMKEFHYIKINQVELLVTFTGSRLPPVVELKLLMDTFHRVDFTGTWKKLFSRVKKHIIWGVLKSVTGMQDKKFKNKVHTQKEQILAAVPDPDISFCDSDGGPSGKFDQHPVAWPKRPSDGAGDGFVTSVKGLFTTQRRKAKAFVLRTMRGEAENEYHGDWSESDVEFSPFARQLTITKAKRLIRRHTKKLRTRGQKDSQQSDSPPSSPTESIPFESDFSEGSSPDQGFSK